MEQSNLKLYVKSMGKVFRVRRITKTVDEANAFCEKHKDCGVIAEDTKDGLIFIADLYSITIKSDLLPE